MSEDKQNNSTQEELRILLSALEIIRKEILSTVIDAQSSIISSVNEQIRLYREGLLTRYSSISSSSLKEEIISDQSIEENSSVETQLQEQEKVETPIKASIVEIVDESLVQPKEPEPTNNVIDILPKDMTKRFKELQWFKTKDSIYLIRNVDTLEQDIKAFWINVLGEKKESEVLTFEGFAYQIVIGKENTVWLRRWTEDQLKTQSKSSSQV